MSPLIGARVFCADGPVHSPDAHTLLMETEYAKQFARKLDRGASNATCGPHTIKTYRAYLRPERI